MSGLVEEVTGQEIWVRFEFDEWIPADLILAAVPERLREGLPVVKVDVKRGGSYKDVRGSIAMVVEEWNDREALGFGILDPEDRSGGLYAMFVTRIRDSETRLWLHFANPEWSASIFGDIRDVFVSVVEQLSPKWGIAGFWLVEGSFGRTLGTLWTDNVHLYAAPRYDWLQVYQPGDFIDVSALEGSSCEFMQIGECRMIVAGATPVLPLASRDAVRAAVVRALPIGEHVISVGTVKFWHRQVVLGTEETGLELPDELQALTSPLRP